MAAQLGGSPRVGVSVSGPKTKDRVDSPTGRHLSELSSHLVCAASWKATRTQEQTQARTRTQS